LKINDQPTSLTCRAIEVIEYIVDVSNDDMEEKDSFRMIVISNPTLREYNEKCLRVPSRNAFLPVATSSAPKSRQIRFSAPTEQGVFEYAVVR
jgi:hypothetical protein